LTGRAKIHNLVRHAVEVAGRRNDDVPFQGVAVEDLDLVLFGGRAERRLT
jgi:hypothetical protein